MVNEEGRCDSICFESIRCRQPVDQKLHTRIGINIRVEHLQETTVLATTQILRQVLENRQCHLSSQVVKSWHFY